MLYLAELYAPRGEDVADLAQRARAAADAASPGMSVAFVQAIFVPLDECCFILYRSASAADVTAAGALAGLDFDRVAEARALL